MKLKKTGSWRNGETDENESPSWRTKAKRRMGRAAVRVFVHNFMRLPECSGAGGFGHAGAGGTGDVLAGA